MTIRKNWQQEIPIIGKEIRRSRILPPGYEEQIHVSMQSIDQKGYSRVPARYKVQDDDTIFYKGRLWYKNEINQITVSGYGEGYRNDMFFELNDRPFSLSWEQTRSFQERK